MKQSSCRGLFQMLFLQLQLCSYFRKSICSIRFTRNLLLYFDWPSRQKGSMKQLLRLRYEESYSQHHKFRNLNLLRPHMSQFRTNICSIEFYDQSQLQDTHNSMIGKHYLFKIVKEIHYHCNQLSKCHHKYLLSNHH